MKGRYPDALKHFRKATQLYEDIGDIVSYSYTLWSVAELYKMQRDFTMAKLQIATALRNFKKTKDPRGIIYCDLTLGEIDLMRGRNAAAEKRLRRALANAGKHSFSLEQCHANTLLAFLAGASVNAVSLSGYKKIGVAMRTRAIPFNIP